jgi:predicted PurR-regulated permease PerM
MNELLQTNVFFFITSIAVVIFTGGFILLLYFLVPLIRDARDLMAKVHTAAEEVEDDFEALRDAAQEEGAKSKVIIDAILGFVGRALSVRPPRKRRRKKS